jgi:hypothetical protein
MTSRSGSGYGSGLISTAWNTLKIVALAHTPSASVSTAVIANVGWARSVRTANRTSCQSLSMSASAG